MAFSRKWPVAAAFTAVMGIGNLAFAQVSSGGPSGSGSQTPSPADLLQQSSSSFESGTLAAPWKLLSVEEPIVVHNILKISKSLALEGIRSLLSQKGINSFSISIPENETDVPWLFRYGMRDPKLPPYIIEDSYLNVAVRTANNAVVLCQVQRTSFSAATCMANQEASVETCKYLPQVLPRSRELGERPNSGFITIRSVAVCQFPSGEVIWSEPTVASFKGSLPKASSTPQK